MDYIVHGVTKSQSWLSDVHFQASNLGEEFTVLSKDFLLNIPEELFKKYIHQCLNPEAVVHKFYRLSKIYNFLKFYKQFWKKLQKKLHVWKLHVSFFFILTATAAQEPSGGVFSYFPIVI